MKIVLTNIIEIQDPTKEIYDYCKKELTFNNPDYIKNNVWVSGLERRQRQ